MKHRDRQDDAEEEGQLKVPRVQGMRQVRVPPDAVLLRVLVAARVQ